MKLAVLSPVAWRTPPQKYGPWEQIASNVAEGMVAKGLDVTLFATGDSITKAALEAVCPHGYEETPHADAKVYEALHISHLMENADRFDVIHNHFDFLPLTYSRLISTPMLTTIHGFSSVKILPVYKKYNNIAHYASISLADRSDELRYISNVYNGINPDDFTYCEKKEDYLLYFGRIHPDKGPHDAISIAKKSGYKLIIAGLIQNQKFFEEQVEPFINQDDIQYVGNAGPAYRNKLLRKAKALLHPIHFDEPFGLSVVEAMYCGTPVVAYQRGSMSELILHGETGFLVNTEDEAVDVLEDLNLISTLACHQWVKKMFTTQIMVDNYLKVYQKLLS